MKRTIAALAALTLIAGACGGDSTEVLEDLGFSVDEAECFTSEYATRNLDLDRVLRAGEGELSDAEQEAIIEVADLCSDSDGSAYRDTGDNADGTETDGGVEDTIDGRTLDSLGPLERAFADSIVDEGASPEAALCVLDEFDAAGIDFGDLFGFGSENEPPTEMLAAIFKCSAEFMGEDPFGFGSVDSDAFTYGDDDHMDFLWNKCEMGDGEACDELFLTSPVGSQYEEFGDTCGFRFEPGGGFCRTMLDGTPDDASTYGSDPLLDELWDACAVGDNGACNDLYFQSPINSGYEEFGSTCGGNGPDTFGSCATGGMFYGEDVGLDKLHDDCAAGDMAACDELYLTSPFGSEYEAFAMSCGGITNEDQYGGCESLFTS